MNKCKIEICAADKTVKASSEWSAFAIMVHSEEYQKGDYILLKTEGKNIFLTICLDDAMPPAIVYIAGKQIRFDIPFDEQKTPYSPKAFSGKLHMLSARTSDEALVFQRRNLALNPYDMTNVIECYPHASANIETRGEAVFAARNTIDGIYANKFHGEYPYQSWGINRDPEAELKIDLGLPCSVDQIRLTMRADFPHDNYWVQASIDFSDGSTEVLKLVKSELPQVFNIRPRTISWAVLKDLVQSDEPSPFPALTQIEIWGQVER